MPTFFFFFMILLIYGCAGSSLLRGLLSSCAQASHCGGLSCCRARALCSQTSSCSSRALEHRLGSCGAWAQLLWAMWDLPGPGLELASPALEGEDPLPLRHQESPQAYFRFQFSTLVSGERSQDEEAWEPGAFSTVLALPSKALGPLASTCCFLSHVQLFRANGMESPRLLCPWNFPGKTTGVGCHFLLQSLLFLIQNPTYHGTRRQNSHK